MQLNSTTKGNKTLQALLPIQTSQITHAILGRKQTQVFSKEDMNSTLMTKSLASHIPREMKLSPNAKPLSPGFFSHQQLTACGCGIHVFGNSVTLDCMFPPPAHEHGIKTYNIISFMIVIFCVVFFLDSFFLLGNLFREKLCLQGEKVLSFFFLSLLQVFQIVNSKSIFSTVSYLPYFSKFHNLMIIIFQIVILVQKRSHCLTFV